MSVIVAKNNITHPSVGGCFDWVPFIVHHLAPLATNRIGKVDFMPADPANHEVVGTAPALVTQVRQLDQRNVPNLDLDKCRIFETHEQSRSRKSAQGDKWSFCLMAGTLCS